MEVAVSLFFNHYFFHIFFSLFSLSLSLSLSLCLYLFLSLSHTYWKLVLRGVWKCLPVSVDYFGANTTTAWQGRRQASLESHPRKEDKEETEEKRRKKIRRKEGKREGE